MSEEKDKKIEEKNNIHDDMLLNTKALLKAIGSNTCCKQSSNLNFFVESEKQVITDKPVHESKAKLDQNDKLTDRSYVLSDGHNKDNGISSSGMNYQKRTRWLICLAFFLILISVFEAIGFIFLSKRNYERVNIIDSVLKNILEKSHINEAKLRNMSDALSKDIRIALDKISDFDKYADEQLSFHQNLSEEMRRLKIERDSLQLFIARQKFELICLRYFSNSDIKEAIQEIDQIEASIVDNQTDEARKLKELIMVYRKKMADNSLPSSQKIITALDRIEINILKLPLFSSKLKSNNLKLSHGDLTAESSKIKEGGVGTGMSLPQTNGKELVDQTKNFASNFDVLLQKIIRKLSAELIPKAKASFMNIVQINKLDETPFSEGTPFLTDKQIPVRNALQFYFAKVRVSIMLHNKTLANMGLKKIINLINENFNSEVSEVSSVLEELHFISKNLLIEDSL